MIIKNDNTTNSIIVLNIDTKKTSYKQLNNFINELEQLVIKYSIVLKGSDCNSSR